MKAETICILVGGTTTALVYFNSPWYVWFLSGMIMREIVDKIIIL